MKNKFLKSGLFFGIFMSIFFIVSNSIEEKSINWKIVVAGIIGGLVGGLVFSFFTKLFTKKIKKIKIEIGESENNLKERLASHFKGIENVGGKLLLTNERLIFKSHKFNIQNHELEIKISEIKKVEKVKTIGLIPNGLRITTNMGKAERFVVDSPNEWINKINELKQNAT